MPDILGTRRSIRCSDGHTRTGTVVYINPYRTFATMEFEGKGGKWREAFFLHQTEKRSQQHVELVEDTIDGRRGKQRHKFTPEEDAEILRTKNTEVTAREFHRSGASIRNRRILLRRRENRV